MPAGAVESELQLRRKRALSDFAVDGGAAQAGALQNRLEPDDAVGICHGECSSPKDAKTRLEQHWDRAGGTQ